MASSIGRGIWSARTLARRVRNWLAFAGVSASAPSRSCPPALVRMDSRWSRRCREGGRPLGGGLIARGEYRRGSRCENHSPVGGLAGSVHGRPVSAGCNASRRRPVPSCAVGSLCVFGILTKWLSFTRLETRTKESYIYASDRVGNSFAE